MTEHLQGWERQTSPAAHRLRVDRKTTLVEVARQNCAMSAGPTTMGSSNQDLPFALRFILSLLIRLVHRNISFLWLKLLRSVLAPTILIPARIR